MHLLPDCSLILPQPKLVMPVVARIAPLRSHHDPVSPAGGELSGVDPMPCAISVKFLREGVHARTHRPT
jgi:hypothetical protein